MISIIRFAISSQTAGLLWWSHDRDDQVGHEFPHGGEYGALGVVLVGLGEALEHHAHCALDGRLHVLLLGDGRAGLHLDDGVRLDVVQQRDVD